MEISESQNETSIAKNRQYFAGNEWYRTAQNGLELYQFMTMSAAHETANSRRVLDIGNGGIFIYPTSHIPYVEAIDIFIEESFRAKYPHVKWRQMSALDLQFDKPFDTVVAVNTLHHVIGDTVKKTYDNLTKIMNGIWRALEPGGSFVLLESTAPYWFLAPYKIVFPILVRFWPIKHPPTFQFHFRDILRAAEAAGLILVEFCWIPKTSDVLTMGFRVKSWMTPIQVGKFVFRKPLQNSCQ